MRDNQEFLWISQKKATDKLYTNKQKKSEVNKIIQYMDSANIIWKLASEQNMCISGKSVKMEYVFS